jgi:hypothetical protein
MGPFVQTEELGRHPGNTEYFHLLLSLFPENSENTVSSYRLRRPHAVR